MALAISMMDELALLLLLASVLSACVTVIAIGVAHIYFNRNTTVGAISETITTTTAAPENISSTSVAVENTHTNKCKVLWKTAVRHVLLLIRLRLRWARLGQHLQLGRIRELFVGIEQERGTLVRKVKFDENGRVLESLLRRRR